MDKRSRRRPLAKVGVVRCSSRLGRRTSGLLGSCVVLLRGVRRGVGEYFSGCKVKGGYARGLLSGFIQFVQVLVRLPNVANGLVLLASLSRGISGVNQVVRRKQGESRFYGLLGRSFRNAFLALPIRRGVSR